MTSLLASFSCPPEYPTSYCRVFSRQETNLTHWKIRKPGQPHARLKLFGFWQRENQIRRLQPSWELLSGRWRRTERKSCSSLACIPSPKSFTMRSATGYSQRQASQNWCRIGDNRSVSPSPSSGREVQL